MSDTTASQTTTQSGHTVGTTESSTKVTFLVEEYLAHRDKWVIASDHATAEEATAQKAKWAPDYLDQNLFRVVEKTVTTTVKVIG